MAWTLPLMPFVGSFNCVASKWPVMLLLFCLPHFVRHNFVVYHCAHMTSGWWSPLSVVGKDGWKLYLCPAKSCKPSFRLSTKNHRITSLRLFVDPYCSLTLFSFPNFVFKVALLGFICITFENKNSCWVTDHQILGIILNTCYEASLAETTI